MTTATPGAAEIRPMMLEAAPDVEFVGEIGERDMAGLPCYFRSTGRSPSDW
jgi:hypothetical protein